MPKWFIVGCAVGAATVTYYVAWSRRSKGMTDRIESATWKARDYATSAVGRAGDAASDVVSKAGDQIDRVRDAAGVGNRSSNDSAGKRL